MHSYRPSVRAAVFIERWPHVPFEEMPELMRSTVPQSVRPRWVRRG
jgi:hypothetical protein